MDDLSRYKEVATLGRKLVDELVTEPSTDTLTRWMAHYIAELIDAADKARPKEREALRRKAFETILELWNHRAELPNGKRPFEDLDPIVRALESLDPERETFHYTRVVREGLVEDEGEETKTLLGFISGLDYSARVLIGVALADAAKSAIDKSKEWVAQAEKAGLSSIPHDVIIRFLASKADIGREKDLTEGERKRLEERIKRLDGFVNLASLVSSDFKRRLKKLTDAKPSPGVGQPSKQTPRSKRSISDRPSAKNKSTKRVQRSNGSKRPR